MTMNDGAASRQAVVRIMIAIRTAEVDPALAHAIRVRVRAGITAAQAEQFIQLFRQLPGKADKYRDGAPNTTRRTRKCRRSQCEKKCCGSPGDST
jgi:hypothetical protein